MAKRPDPIISIETVDQPVGIRVHFEEHEIDVVASRTFRNERDALIHFFRKAYQNEVLIRSLIRFLKSKREIEVNAKIFSWVEARDIFESIPAI